MMIIKLIKVQFILYYVILYIILYFLRVNNYFDYDGFEKNIFTLQILSQL